MATRFTYLWEFEVPEANTAEFLRHYAPGGSWSVLFRKDPSYIETLLLKDDHKPGRFVTIDRWQSASAYRAFRNQYAEEYGALDRLCEGLTTSEKELGSFEEV